MAVATDMDLGILVRELEFGALSISCFCLGAWFWLRSAVNAHMGRKNIAVDYASFATFTSGVWLFLLWAWLISISRIAGFRTTWDPRNFLYGGFVGTGAAIFGAIWTINRFSPENVRWRVTAAVLSFIVAGMGLSHAVVWYLTGGNFILTPIK